MIARVGHENGTIVVIVSDAEQYIGHRHLRTYLIHIPGIPGTRIAYAHALWVAA